MKKHTSIALVPLMAGMVAFMTGCATTVNYGDATSAQALSTDFGASDLQQTAATMVDSLLTFPPIIEATAKRRPVLTVGKVQNKTMQRIDCENLTDSIRTKLIKTGKFRFIDRTTEDQAIEEVRQQQEDGLSKNKKTRAFGNQSTAEYMLTANLTEITQKSGNLKDVYYKFTMSMKNLETGELDWSDEKEIRKQGKRATFGM